MTANASQRLDFDCPRRGNAALPPLRNGGEADVGGAAKDGGAAGLLNRPARSKRKGRGFGGFLHSHEGYRKPLSRAMPFLAEPLYCATGLGRLASSPMPQAKISQIQHQEAVAGRLKQIAPALGMQAKDVAAKLGVSPQRFNGWINGPHGIPPFYLAELCRVLPVTADWLLLGETRTLSVDMAERLAQVSEET